MDSKKITTCVACDVCEILLRVRDAHLVPGRRDGSIDIGEDGYWDTFLCDSCAQLERVPDDV